MKKIKYLIFTIFYLLLNNSIHAKNLNVSSNDNEQSGVEAFYTRLNSIVMTAINSNEVESDPQVSVACTKVGTGGVDSLNNRISFCQKFYMEVDVYNPDGPNNTAYVTGYVFTEDNNSVNTLDWPTKFRFRTTYANPLGPFIQAAPSLECGTIQSKKIPARVNLCDRLTLPSILLNPGLSSVVEVKTRMNLDHIEHDIYEMHERYADLYPDLPPKNMWSENSYHYTFNPEIKVYFSPVGTVVSDNSTYLTTDKIPNLRCDFKAARSDNSGCIFPDAPAILRSINMAVTDVNEKPKVKQSVEHILEAQNKGLPGKFYPIQGSILPDEELSKPLRRLIDVKLINNQRRYSTAICRKTTPSFSDECQTPENSSDTIKGCQCDEYPFASTYEGGNALGIFGDATSGPSVKMITGGDNASAGGRLGNFYISQRVIEGEKFYVNVE